MGLEVNPEKFGLTTEKYEMATAVVGVLGPFVLDGDCSRTERNAFLPRNLTLKELHRVSGIAPTKLASVIEGQQCLSQERHIYLQHCTDFADGEDRIWRIRVVWGDKDPGVKRATRIAGRKLSRRRENHSGGSMQTTLENVLKQRRVLDKRIILQEVTEVDHLRSTNFYAQTGKDIKL